MICCLSTCVFPDGLDSNEPMTENDLHKGEPHNSNFGYAYAKRILDVHCRLINESDPTKRYQSIIPCNIYGPHDNFHDPENAHVIPALISKCAALKELGYDTLDIKGSGNPKRQFIYSGDLAHIIVNTIIHDVDYGPEARLICSPGPHVEYSIKDVATLIAEQFNIGNVAPENDNESNINDGQKSKTCSNCHLNELFDVQLTTLEEGIEITCNWYKVSYLYSKSHRR
jgi:GDP-L-fucose synthase